jgi:hypothetical protein
MAYFLRLIAILWLGSNKTSSNWVQIAWFVIRLGYGLCQFRRSLFRAEILHQKHQRQMKLNVTFISLKILILLEQTHATILLMSYHFANWVLVQLNLTLWIGYFFSSAAEHHSDFLVRVCCSVSLPHRRLKTERVCKSQHQQECQTIFKKLIRKQILKPKWDFCVITWVDGLKIGP